MITPDQIRDKAVRIYPTYVKAWLLGDDFFPRRIPAKLTLPGDHSAAKKVVESLRQKSKQVRGSGYQVQWETRKSRSHGLNEFPVALFVETENDLLSLAGKTIEFEKLKSATGTIRRQQPRLEDWLKESTRWKDVVKVADQFDQLMLMTQYLLDHPRPDCFAREIPLQVSTKLVEENRQILAQWLDRLLPAEQIDFRFGREEFELRYGLRSVRHHLLFRCLDPDLKSELGLRFGESSLPPDSINQLNCRDVSVFVVENKVNLLTFPEVKRGIAIGGLGKAISITCKIEWLTNVPVYYWGDLDVEGFEILSLFRQMFPHAQSLLMNMKTYRQYEELAIDWPNAAGAEPVALTQAERSMYQFLVEHKRRLEQERIPQEQVEAALTDLMRSR